MQICVENLLRNGPSNSKNSLEHTIIEFGVQKTPIVHENTMSGPGMIPAEVSSLDLRIRVLGASLDMTFHRQNRSSNVCGKFCLQMLSLLLKKAWGYRNEYECNGNDRYEEQKAVISARGWP
jgi:hypothetical protein